MPSALGEAAPLRVQDFMLRGNKIMPESKKAKLKTDKVVSETLKRQLKEVLLGQRWNNLSTNKDGNYNRLEQKCLNKWDFKILNRLIVQHWGILNKGKESSTYPTFPILTKAANNEITAGELFPNEELANKE